MQDDILVDSGDLTWMNVGIALTFVLFDIGVSTVLRLGIGVSLLIAALRCMGQLALVAAVLHKVFETKNPWHVAFICCASALSLFSVLDSHLLPLSCIESLGHFRDGYVNWY
jgi:ABC-type iron transport system FetAB permease component